ncbi:DUF445 family protein [Thermodesulfobium narugense]|uniref:DUF445 family protein n=1 Tax=Thermodesulfobium narugense TaxID=184064 RepID=UPI0002D8E08A|nr:DUF445 family protein [Thermodesulfobium narugense]
MKFDRVFFSLLIPYVLLFIFGNMFKFEFFLLIMPIFLGALVGYVTNVVAVWMIFNPKKKRFGYQGIVPKSKLEISERLSSVVEKELINHDSIMNMLENKSERVKKSLVDFLYSLLNNDFGTAKDCFKDKSSRFRSMFVRLYEKNLSIIVLFIDSIILKILSNPLNKLVNLEKIRTEIITSRNNIKEKFDTLLAEKTLADIFGNENLDLICNKIKQYLQSDFQEVLYSRLSEMSLNEIIPSSKLIVNFIINWLYTKLSDDEFVEKIASFIEEEIRASKKGIVEEALFFYTNVFAPNYISDKIKKFVATLRDEISSNEVIIEGIELSVNELMRKKINEIITADSFFNSYGKVFTFFEPNIDDLKLKIYNLKILDYFNYDVFEKVLFGLLNYLYENKEKIYFKNLYLAKRENFKIWLYEILGSDKANKKVNAIVEYFLSRRIGNIVLFFENMGLDIELILKDIIDRLYVYIKDWISLLISHVDVKLIVKEKIDSFSVEEMERLVFGIMDKEFRIIELLGVPIGALLGIIQVVMSLFK